MATHRITSEDGWVEERMAELLAAPGGEADAERGLARWRERRRRRARQRVGAAVAAALSAVALLWPETRVYASRCLEACVVGGQSVMARLRPDTGGPRRVAPDLTVTARDGAEIRLRTYLGRVVAVNFWATWCPPCRTETPWLVEFERRYAAEGFGVVGLSLDDDPAAVDRFAAAAGVNYPLALTDPETLRDWSGGVSVPVTVIVDRRGQVAAVLKGTVSRERLERLILETLREEEK